MPKHRVLVIIPASRKNEANRAALAYDPEGGGKTFTVALSLTGGWPITHYWMSGSFDDAEYQKLLAAHPYATIEEWDMDANPGRPAALLEEQWLRPVRNT